MFEKNVAIYTVEYKSRNVYFHLVQNHVTVSASETFYINCLHVMFTIKFISYECIKLVNFKTVGGFSENTLYFFTCY